jgi:hypothetical protein
MEDAMQEALVYLTWDETGEYAAHTDADEAAELLEEKSSGKFRRVMALRLSLPPSIAIEMRIAVVAPEPDGSVRIG